MEEAGQVVAHLTGRLTATPIPLRTRSSVMSQSTMIRPSVESNTCTLDHEARYIPSDLELEDYAQWLTERGETGQDLDECCPIEDREGRGPRFSVVAIGLRFGVRDLVEDEIVEVCDHLQEAINLASDANAENWPAVYHDGQPWYASLPTDPQFLDVPIGLGDSHRTTSTAIGADEEAKLYGWA